MSTYKQIFYQIVFSTKSREATLTEAHSEELYKYIWGIIRERHCKLYRISGIEEHIHIFSDLHPSISLADYVKDIKQGSGNWMRASGMYPKFSGWSRFSGAMALSRTTLKKSKRSLNTSKTKKNITRQSRPCGID